MSDVASDLAAAYDAVAERTGVDAAPETVTPAVETTPETPEQKDRARDESGRFTKAEKAEQKAEQAEQVTPQPSKRKYPSSWKKEYEPIYRKAESDPELVKLLEEAERREGDFHKGLSEYKTDAEYARAVKQALAPFDPYIASYGIDPVQAVHQMFAADYMLRTGTPQQKLQMAAKLLNDYGIDPSVFSAPPQEQGDPRVRQLEEQLAQFQQQQAYLAQQQDWAARNELQQQLAAFAEGKEHFETVREDMAALIAAGRATTLEDAYEMACRANPNVFTSIAAKQREEIENQLREEAKRKAQEAKRAGFDVKGAGGVGIAPAGSKLSIADELRSLVG